MVSFLFVRNLGAISSIVDTRL